MPRILILLAVAVIAYSVISRVRKLPPPQRRSAYLKLVFTGLLLLVVWLTITGKMHWIGAALTALLVLVRQVLPLVLRAFPMLQGLLRMRQQAGRQATVQTTLLRVRVDVTSGVIDGEVLSGQFAGQKLADLNEQQLEELLKYCQQEDIDSARLLMSYLQRNRQGNWSENNQYSQSAPSSNLDRKEALAVLGLEEGASKKDIITAHRKLMQKIHPDRGGNDYLAAKINQAKDLLLG